MSLTPLDRTLWRLAPPLPDPSALIHATHITPLQAQLLNNRGISNPDEVRDFLDPSLSKMANPMGMMGMEAAVQTVVKALENKKKVTVYGDYDADGLTATALLLHFFYALDADVDAYIPDRFKEGYGLNGEAVKQIAAKGKGLLITVDCGISGEAETALAMGLGMDVVVTDHHQVPDGAMHACPVINPHQPGCGFIFKALSGVGVAFFLTVAVRSALRERGWSPSRPEPDLREYLDLVALGTVADRVPLVGENRRLATVGLRRMARTRWPGIRALMSVCGVDESHISSDDLAFRLAPRLNAPGRLGAADRGLRLLTAADTKTAATMARELDQMNSRRQVLEQEVLSAIEKRLKAGEGLEGHRRTLVFGGEEWHQGVLGIVASRLVERFHRPALVFSISDGLAIGSGRSISGFNLYEALHRHKALFQRFGGHAHAAGMRLSKGNLRPLAEGFEAWARTTLSDEDLVPVVDVDAALALETVDGDLIRQLTELAPFGEENPEPVFMTQSVEVLSSGVVGERHIKLKVRQGRKALDAIAFRMAPLKPSRGSRVDLLFTPEINRWQGRDRIQLRVVDLRSSDTARD
ncbi:MAG: single-stranded-DNA-specific exonuclease RecJ [Deltaproteobacteria bacterium]|nr:single-stranded-DNA-specific exonuclease RecJ [Deltaproteobacteria bacterium]